jgi:hypothetical protein
MPEGISASEKEPSAEVGSLEGSKEEGRCSATRRSTEKRGREHLFYS